MANSAPAATDAIRKLLKASPRTASQRVEAFNITKAAVFLSKYLNIKI